MAQGDIYRALSRNKNLEPTVEAVKNIVYAARKQKLQTELANAMSQMDNLENVPNQMPIGGNSIIPSMQMADMEQNKYNQANKIGIDALFGGLQGGMDKQELGAYGNLFQNRANMFKPAEKKAPEITQVDPYKDLYINGVKAQGAKEKTVEPKMPLEDELKLKNKYAKEMADYKDKIDDGNRTTKIPREAKIVEDKKIPSLIQEISHLSNILDNDTDDWRLTTSKGKHDITRSKVTSLTDELIRRADLEGPVNNLWMAYNKHKDLGKAIADYNEYAEMVGEEPIGDEQLRVIKIYFKNRTPKQNEQN